MPVPVHCIVHGTRSADNNPCDSAAAAHHRSLNSSRSAEAVREEKQRNVANVFIHPSDLR